MLSYCDHGGSPTKPYLDLCYALRVYDDPVHLNEMAAALRVPLADHSYPNYVWIRASLVRGQHDDQA